MDEPGRLLRQNLGRTLKDLRGPGAGPSASGELDVLIPPPGC